MSGETMRSVTRGIVPAGEIAMEILMTAFELCDEDDAATFIELVNAVTIAAVQLGQSPAEIAALVERMAPDVTAALDDIKAAARRAQPYHA